MEVEQRAPGLPMPVQVGLLGVVAVRQDGTLDPVPGRRARALLAALAVDPGRWRSAELLIGEVWEDQPPRSPTNALHTQISRLRALLPPGMLEAGPAGYRLVLGRAEVDVTRAEDLVRRARGAEDSGDHPSALRLVAEASALWRGESGTDLPTQRQADELRIMVQAVRRDLEEVQLDAQLGQGAYTQVLPHLRERCAQDPMDEAAHAAMMRCLAALGRANEALAVFAALRARLAEELGADPSPELVGLHTLILRGELPAAPTEQSPRALAVGLRAAPNPLLGRDEDIAALQALLASSRVVTILGPGGTGKTRLAHELGRAAAQVLPVALVELAGVRSAEDVIGAISATAGVSEAEIGPDGIRRTRRRDIRDRLRESLSARPSLLILDNCEHVIAAAAEIVADLVAAGPELTVLTTSRTPLMVAAEAVYQLPPLHVDEGGSPATDLFCTRARAVRPGARLEATVVAQLCRTLDGLPLAIELAAARVRTMSVEEIHARIADRFALLRATDRTTPERHRTLRAVIEWSWNLLDGAERAALRRLCRLPAGFSRAAAEEVAAWGECADIDSALDGLVNQSLLSLSEHPAPVGLRYHMLETVREFGEERLAGEAEQVARRQAAWARALALRLAERYLSGQQLEAIGWVEAEHENLVAALRHAVAASDPCTALTVFPVLAGYWAIRGAHSEVYLWAPRILDVSNAPTEYVDLDPNLVAACYLAAVVYLSLPGAGRPLARARTRLRRMVVAESLDETVLLGARAALARPGAKGFGRLLAAGIRSARPDTRLLAYIIRASLQENAGNRAQAWRDTLRALDLARQRKDLWAQGMAAQMLGGLNSQAARYADAVGYYRLSARMLYELHAYEESAQARGFVGAALVGAGEVVRGRREALAALGPQQDPVIGGHIGQVAHAEYEASVTATLAEADLAEGNTERGLELYRKAVVLCGLADEAQFADPFASLVTSAAVCAHVAAGARGSAHELLAPLLDTVLVRHLGSRSGQTFPDLPIIGALAVAVSSMDVGDPVWSANGVRLLAIAGRAGARQDYPSLRLDRHLAAARLVVGDELVDAEVSRATALRRAVLGRELSRLLVRRYQALRM